MGEVATTGAAASVSAPESRAAAPAQPVQPGNERDAYTVAFDMMRARQFEESIQAFTAFLQQYPDGVYSANAHYWLGELHLAGNDLEQARQSFTQVVNGFPEHQKVADALYKLGVTQHRLGDTQRALEFLNRVQAEFPNSSAAGLASTYAAELQ